ncbi:unnamed protein product [Rodentolepis nana]|uniref:CCDC66 domain-containing protein n=1 Tax=Rodentolepis nana TaxID=102285 RepID=A0A0R3TK15_RODNA|nr:unnamed protein product [Rodentolepis nana]
MSLGSGKIRAELDNRARQEILNNSKIDSLNTNINSTKAGIVSQQKLAQVLCKTDRAHLTPIESNSSKPSQQSISQIDQGVDHKSGILNSFDNFPFSNEIFKEAVNRLIELNKDKLTDSQLVDLVSSFYLVTNQCLKQFNANAVDSSIYSSAKSQTSDNIDKHQTGFSVESLESGKVTIASDSPNPPLTLMERKRLQWMQENEELERLSKGRALPAVHNPTMAEGVMHHEKVINPAPPPAKDHHRFKRSNYLAGLPVGEDPQAEAVLKEQKRRQWLADLDHQIEERRIAREQERLKNLALDSAPPRRSQEIDSSLTAPAYTEVKSASYGRGRGLADLMGRQESESATKRERQRELKEAYAEQMRERDERRRKEREAEAKADEAIRLEIERERRLIEEQELKLAQRRRQTELEAQERLILKITENNEKQPQSNIHHSSSNASRIPRSTNQPVSQPGKRPNDLKCIKKEQFGSTYTISNPTGRSNSGSIDVHNQNRINKDTPTVIRTESTLISSSPPSFPPSRPTSDFLSAIADPDFAYPQESRDSALREVSRIKENLAKRQNELRSMQQN